MNTLPRQSWLCGITVQSSSCWDMILLLLMHSGHNLSPYHFWMNAVLMAMWPYVACFEVGDI